MHLHDLEHWMWAEACEILNRADRLHRQFFFKPAVMSGKRLGWEPPVDIYETSDEFKIMIALPGVAPEQLSIVLDQEHLIIAGQRNLPDATEAHIRRLEIPYGRFDRHIKLPTGHLEIGASEFINGCLIIVLRKL